MEFSFKVSEPEFRQAWKLERKASSRSTLKSALFWILIMLGLFLLYRLIQPGSRVPGMSDQRAATRAVLAESVSNEDSVRTTLARVGPFLVIAGICFLIVGGMILLRLRHLYRKDPRMQGDFTVDISRDGIVTKNTVGTTSKSSWNVYDSWCEGRGIIVLLFHSGSYSVLSLAGLAEPQRNELRGILAGALEKRSLRNRSLSL